MSRFLAILVVLGVSSVGSAQDLDARIAARLNKVEKDVAELKAEVQALKAVSQDKKAPRLITSSGATIERQPDGTYRYVGTPPVIQYQSGCVNGRCFR